MESRLPVARSASCLPMYRHRFTHGLRIGCRLFERTAGDLYRIVHEAVRDRVISELNGVGIGEPFCDRCFRIAIVFRGHVQRLSNVFVADVTFFDQNAA